MICSSHQPASLMLRAAHDGRPRHPRQAVSTALDNLGDGAGLFERCLKTAV